MNSMTNSPTLNSYNANLPAYIQGTPQEVSGSVQEWIHNTLHYLPSNSRILEIGSAFGRDAAYIETQGFLVERSDAAISFVEHLRNQGYETKHFNVLTDTIPEPYDLIFANAVFLHFTEAELHTVLTTVNQGLNPSGLLSFSVKEGIGAEWTEEKLSAPRYFRYWEKEPLAHFVSEHGFHILSITSDGKFLQLIARKSNDHQ